MNSRFLGVLAGVVLATSLVSPALAQTSTSSTSTRFQSQVCQGIVRAGARIDQRIETAKGKLGLTRTEIGNRIRSRWAEVDGKVTLDREQAEFNRGQHYEKLEARAATDPQKAAVAEFKASIEAAVDARHAAVNAAAVTFRQGLTDVLKSRNAKIDAASGAYASAVVAAFDKAEADCNAGVSVATIGPALRASLKAAWEKFVSDRRAIDAFITQFEPLVTARRAALQKAHDDFKAAAEAAGEKLKLAFGEA